LSSEYGEPERPSGARSAVLSGVQVTREPGKSQGEKSRVRPLSVKEFPEQVTKGRVCCQNWTGTRPDV